MENHADEIAKLDGNVVFSAEAETEAGRLRKRLNREDLPMSITAAATRNYLNCYNS